MANDAELIRAWLAQERDYTVQKFGLELDDQHVRDWDYRDESDWWNQQFDNYYTRAGVLGLDTLVGRQAFAKFVATAVGMLEAAVRVYGPLPLPGVPSGENLDTVFTDELL